ncbi:acetoacetate--CoA ligase [Streptomyces sp. NPDC091215]|uniref:acetoacetate--CoA ligase n=1 Tax=Streptomyces sp. NPDC091215 TaxID=3155192 RepID=UPI00341FDEBF
MSSKSVQGQEPRALWTPPADWRMSTRIGAFAEFLKARRGISINGYDDLWRFSVGDLDGFWTSVWDFFQVAGVPAPGPAVADPPGAVLPGTRWFPQARLNYARHLLVDADPQRTLDGDIAVVAHSQTRDRVTLTFAELRSEVAKVQAGLLRLGVGKGDRVAAYLPNIPETLIAFLATASLGAVWSACAPEFGVRSVVDRFSQVQPKVLLAVSGYRYGQKKMDRRTEVTRIAAELPSVQHVVHVPYGEFTEASDDLPVPLIDWSELGPEASGSAEVAFEEVPFEHPLYVLFSSGTTGKPKAIVHGHGGILLEHLKNHALSWDLGPGDRLLWFATTAWMMWNSLVSALLVRSSIVMIDGDVLHPDLSMQWRLASETGTTHMGLSPGFIMATRKAGVAPGKAYDLSRIRHLASAGSPLPVEGYEWVADEFPGVLLNVGSGGTDVCSGIVQGSPLQTVWAGEISGPSLGVKAQAFNDHSQPVVGELGELVITEPMPSMPVGFWGDADGSRYRAAYFEHFPGVWRHGDWVRFSERGSAVVTGRSDATLNRGGVRLGTAEFYRVVEELPEVAEALVVHLESPDGGMGELLLYTVLTPGNELTDILRARIARELRTALSPRHTPDSIIATPTIPHTRTGKKLELPVKRLLQGKSRDEVATPGSLADDSALDFYVAEAAARAAGGTA